LNEKPTLIILKAVANNLTIVNNKTLERQLSKKEIYNKGIQYEQFINDIWTLVGNSRLLLSGFICRIAVTPGIQKETLPLYGV